MVLSFAAAITACGGATGVVVVQVGGNLITTGTLDHWMSVQANVGGPTPTHQALQRRVLGLLISSERAIGQAAELGVEITDAEVKGQLERFNYDQNYGTAERFPREAELQKLLSIKGESV